MASISIQPSASVSPTYSPTKLAITSGGAIYDSTEHPSSLPSTIPSRKSSVSPSAAVETGAPSETSSASTQQPSSYYPPSTSPSVVVSDGEEDSVSLATDSDADIAATSIQSELNSSLIEITTLVVEDASASPDTFISTAITVSTVVVGSTTIDVAKGNAYMIKLKGSLFVDNFDTSYFGASQTVKVALYFEDAIRKRLGDAGLLSPGSTVTVTFIGSGIVEYEVFTSADVRNSTPSSNPSTLSSSSMGPTRDLDYFLPRNPQSSASLKRAQIFGVFVSILIWPMLISLIIAFIFLL